jgi:hypothetical protein
MRIVGGLRSPTLQHHEDIHIGIAQQHNPQSAQKQHEKQCCTSTQTPAHLSPIGSGDSTKGRRVTRPLQPLAHTPLSTGHQYVGPCSQLQGAQQSLCSAHQYILASDQAGAVQLARSAYSNITYAATQQILQYHTAHTPGKSYHVLPHQLPMQLPQAHHSFRHMPAQGQ